MDFAQYNEIQIFFKPRFFQSRIDGISMSFHQCHFTQVSNQRIRDDQSQTCQAEALKQGFSWEPLWSCFQVPKVLVPAAPWWWLLEVSASHSVSKYWPVIEWLNLVHLRRSLQKQWVNECPMSRETVCGCPLNKELPCGFQVIYGFPDPGMICNLAQMWWNHNFELFSVFSWVLFTLSDIKDLKETIPRVQAWCRCNWCDFRHVWQVPTLCQALDTIFLHCKCQWLQRFSPIPSMQPSSFPCEILGLAATQHWTICHGGMWCGRVEMGGICTDLHQLKDFWRIFGVTQSFEIPIWGGWSFFFWGGILWSICVCVSLIGFAAFSAFCSFSFCFVVASCATAASSFCLQVLSRPPYNQNDFPRLHKSWKQKPFAILTLMLC